MAFFRCVAVAALLTLATASTSSKRGLCFVPEKHRRDHPHPEDNAIWATRRSDLTWYYNYEAAPSPDYKGMTGFEFVPMLWGVPDGGLIGTPFLDSIRQQIKNGLNITHVLGFNEPDASDNGGSNISPHLAAQIWKANVEPLKEDGINLGAPAITGSPRGAMWLQDFLSHCNGSCNPDFLPLHFYGDFESVASKIGEVTRAYPKLPIWVTEWGYSNQSLHDTHWAFNESLRLFDNWNNITRYSYYGAFRSDISNVGPNAAMLTENGELTDIGSWYLGGAATNNVPHGSQAGNVAPKATSVMAVVFSTVVGFLAIW